MNFYPQKSMIPPNWAARPAKYSAPANMNKDEVEVAALVGVIRTADIFGAFKGS